MEWKQNDFVWNELRLRRFLCPAVYVAELRVRPWAGLLMTLSAVLARGAVGLGVERRQSSSERGRVRTCLSDVYYYQPLLNLLFRTLHIKFNVYIGLDLGLS